jgi:hypothetical protein
VVHFPSRNASGDELNTVGPEYEKRRMAAVIGLLLSGDIEHFARARDHQGRPLDIALNPDLTKEDIYLRRLMPRWTEMSQALGGDQAVLERLQICRKEACVRCMPVFPTQDACLIC